MPVTMEPTPYWIDSASMPAFRKLSRDDRVDVVIVNSLRIQQIEALKTAAHK